MKKKKARLFLAESMFFENYFRSFYRLSGKLGTVCQFLGN